MAVLTSDVAYVACGYRYWDQAMEFAIQSCQRLMAGSVVGWCHFVLDIHTSLDRHNCSLMACLSKRPWNVFICDENALDVLYLHFRVARQVGATLHYISQA